MLSRCARYRHALPILSGSMYVHFITHVLSFMYLVFNCVYTIYFILALCSIMVWYMLTFTRLLAYIHLCLSLSVAVSATFFPLQIHPTAHPQATTNTPSGSNSRPSGPPSTTLTRTHWGVYSATTTSLPQPTPSPGRRLGVSIAQGKVVNSMTQWTTNPHIFLLINHHTFHLYSKSCLINLPTW
jgi:hypothetical protein